MNLPSFCLSLTQWSVGQEDVNVEPDEAICTYTLGVGQSARGFEVNGFPTELEAWMLGSLSVWPEKNRQMSIKIAQKWFY